MYPSLKRLVLAAVLVVMPLQGVAAMVSAALCHGDSRMHAVHAGGDHDRGGAPQRSPQDDGASGDSGYHPCQNTVSAPPAVASTPAAPDFSTRALAPEPLQNSFVPERPQRPPLA